MLSMREYFKLFHLFYRQRAQNTDPSMFCNIIEKRFFSWLYFNVVLDFFD